MKTFKLLIALILMLGFSYYLLDRHLFYYGRNDLSIFHLLPFKVMPEYKPSFEGGFELRDQDLVGFAGNGLRYAVDGREVVINKILSYGYNAKQIVAIVVDSGGIKYDLSTTSIPSSTSLFDVTIDSFQNIDSSSFTKWVTIEGNQESVQRIWVCHNIILFVMIILIPVAVVYAIKGTWDSKNEKRNL